MEELGDIAIPAETWQEFLPAWNRVVPSLPKEVKERLIEIRQSYLARYGVEGVFKRMSNRRLSQILAEFEPGDVIPLASGEKDGLKWSLWDKTDLGNDKAATSP